MSLEETVSNIVRQVVNELMQQKGNIGIKAQQKKLLLLISDNRHAAAVEQLIQVISEYYDLTLAYCGDYPIQDIGLENDDKHAKIQLTNGDRSSWIDAVNHADIVVMPILQLGTLVKISNLVDDEPASGMVVNALMSGKDVVVSSSYVFPAGAQKLSVPPVMIDVVSSHFQQLIKYGVHVVYMKNLESKLKALSTLNQDSKRPLIHARHVQEWINEGETHISLSANTLITPLAKEAAKELGLKWSFDYKEE